MYSPLLHQKLATCYTNYNRSPKAQKGGRNRELYHSLAWQVPIDDSDVASVALQQQVTELTNGVATLDRDKGETSCSNGMSLLVITNSVIYSYL